MRPPLSSSSSFLFNISFVPWRVKIMNNEPIKMFCHNYEDISSQSIKMSVSGGKGQKDKTSILISEKSVIGSLSQDWRGENGWVFHNRVTFEAESLPKSEEGMRKCLKFLREQLPLPSDLFVDRTFWLTFDSRKLRRKIFSPTFFSSHPYIIFINVYTCTYDCVRSYLNASPWWVNPFVTAETRERQA